MGQFSNRPPFSPLDQDPVYIRLMNQTELNVFFRALHDAEDVHNANVIDADPEYLEGYDYIMDIVKDAIMMDEEVRDMYSLDNFINQADAYAEDNEGEYGKGYQDAVNLCLEAVSVLLQSEEV